MENNKEIGDLLADFNTISGFRVTLFDTKENVLDAYPGKDRGHTALCAAIQRNPTLRAQCFECDRQALKIVQQTGETYIYTCPHGLIEAAAPIYNYGVLTGYLMVGQVREDSLKAYNNIIELNSDYFNNKTILKALIDDVPAIPKQKIKSFLNLMSITAAHITKTHKLSVQDSNLPALIREHIDSNFKDEIALETLSRKFGFSKSTLMNSFKKEYGITIKSYTIKKRMQTACDMLKNSRKSVGEIAELCGISDQNYFTKIFTRTYGCSPTTFRKNNAKK
ncbi:MAG: PocR ligand-binding domain-containing protein [Clostridia bacterium]|nr:PocR ligand-binding domain-containing protein [Clostridia bacterium]